MAICLNWAKIKLILQNFNLKLITFNKKFLDNLSKYKNKFHFFNIRVDVKNVDLHVGATHVQEEDWP